MNTGFRKNMLRWFLLLALLVLQPFCNAASAEETEAELKYYLKQQQELLAKTSDKLKRAAIKGQIELIKEKLKNLKKNGGTDGTDYENDPEYQAEMEEFRRGLDEKQSQHRYNAENVTVESQLDRLRDGDDYVARVATRRDEPQAAEGAPESGKDYLAYITKPTGGVVIEGLDPHAKVYPTNYSFPERHPNDDGPDAEKITRDVWDSFRDNLSPKQLTNLYFALMQMNKGEMPIFYKEENGWYVACDPAGSNREFYVSRDGSFFYTFEKVMHDESENWFHIEGDLDGDVKYPGVKFNPGKEEKDLEKKQAEWEKASSGKFSLIGANVFAKGYIDVYNNQDNYTIAYTKISDFANWTLKFKIEAGERMRIGVDGRGEFGVMWKFGSPKKDSKDSQKDDKDDKKGPMKGGAKIKAGIGVTNGQMDVKFIANMLMPDPRRFTNKNKRMMVSVEGGVTGSLGYEVEQSYEYDIIKGKAKGRLKRPLGRWPLSVGVSLGLEEFKFIDVDDVESSLPTNKKSN